MKQIFWSVIFFICLSLPAWAGEYAGLTPGQSTKQEVDQELGRPVKSYQNNRYDYSSEGHDLARLTVQFTPKNIISRIHLFFQEPYAVEQIREWFGLPDKAAGVETIEGHLVELYENQGIKIVFEGGNNAGNVVQVSHVDFSRGGESSAADTCPAAAERYAQQADPFIEKDQYERAIPYLKKAAMCDAETSIYSSMLAVAYYETGKTNEAIKAAEHSVNVGEDYVANTLLGTIYFTKKEYKKAIPHFQRAVDIGHSKEKDFENLEYLGTCFYEEDRLQEAMATFTKVNKRMKKRPITCYYIGLISDRLGDIAGAKFFYKKFLRLKYDNQDMTILAKERLGALNRQSRKKNSRSVSDLIGVVTKEIKDFNTD